MSAETYGVMFAALIGGAVAVIGTLVSYISLRQNQASETRDLEARLRQEHLLIQERMEKEHRQQIERMKAEQAELLRSVYNQKQLEAHQKLWALLLPIAQERAEADAAIVRNEEGVYLNLVVIDVFFKDFQNFYYSEDGIFVSKPTREAIFTVRDFIGKMRQEATPEPNGYVIISNTKAKKIENGFSWIRKNIRRDAGLINWQMPLEDLKPLED